MRSKQRGITISGLVIWLVILSVLALLAMRLIPAYMEYGSARNAIRGIARDPGFTAGRRSAAPRASTPTATPPARPPMCGAPSMHARRSTTSP